MGQKKDEFTYYLTNNKGGVFKTEAGSTKEAKARRDQNLPIAGGCLIPLILVLIVIGILL